jgi:DNA gyrase/topoisomerase IV subunit A
LLPEPFTITSDVTIDELLEFIKGPDFPTAGAIYDWQKLKMFIQQAEAGF